MGNVSVAMAVYRGEKYLGLQLDSILHQLRADDELVISYDESPDRTLEIIERYAKEYPQVKVVHDPESGVFSNFENAVAHCHNEYIFLSDQDDIWEPNKTEVMLKAFRETDADMVIHNGVHIDAEGTVISEDFFSMYHIRANPVRNFAKPRYSGCCTAFRRELCSVLLPIPRGVGAYDHWVGMVGECFGKIAFIDDPLIRHRLHGGNVTPEKRRSIDTVLKVRMRLLIELMKRRNISYRKDSI